MRHVMMAATAALVLAAPMTASADEISDTITSALEAYEAGDIRYALDELAYATQLLNELRAEGLSTFLPEPMAGWTRELDEDVGTSMGFMGGGSIAQAEYSGPGDSFTITLMADNPMVASMGAMLGNPQIMASMGRVERINRVSFLNQDGDLSGLIANRILVQAEGGETETMIAHLEMMDFGAMQDFGQ